MLVVVRICTVILPKVKAADMSTYGNVAKCDQVVSTYTTDIPLHNYIMPIDMTIVPSEVKRNSCPDVPLAVKITGLFGTCPATVILQRGYYVYETFLE